MRTWGRARSNSNSPGPWVKVETDINGNNDAVMITTLAQVLLLNDGESPFWANYGIPARPSVYQQLAPDYYVSRTQRQFAPLFASLIIAKQSTPEPSYRVNLITNQGVPVQAVIAT